MQRFKRILFVGRGTHADSYGLIQALSVAREYGASVTAVHVSPELPDQLRPYKDALLRSLDEELSASIDRARAEICLRPEEVRVERVIECANTPVMHLIQRVLREGYDLLIKEADQGVERNGFRAFDMQLLRKCPCPVWLCRPISRSRSEIRVGVAIDPVNHERADLELTLEILRLGRSIADTCSRSLAVISCWEFEYEDFLFESPWSSIPQEEVRAAVDVARRQHLRELQRVLDQSSIGDSYEVHHMRGNPADSVPLQVEQLDLDILVMGTVGRTGIPGFFIGNTAENIVQKIRCTLVAMKPPGFVSPVAVS